MRSRPIAAVLSDISMPGGTGFDLLRQTQSLGYFMPFAFMTGYGTEEFLTRAIRLGAVDFLSKPVSREDLDAVIQRLAAIGDRQIGIDRILENLGAVSTAAKEAIDDLRLQIGLLRVTSDKPKDKI